MSNAKANSTTANYQINDMNPIKARNGYAFSSELQKYHIHRCNRTQRNGIGYERSILLLILLKASCAMCESGGLSIKVHELEAEVSSHVVFNCPIDFPYDYEIPYVLHWTKDEKNILTLYEGDITINNLFHGRLNLVTNHRDYGKASLNLTAIRESDQGRYHCQIRFPNRTPSIRNNGTWYFLTVQGSLIKIPPVNLTIMEGQAAIFPCVMKYSGSQVKWYRDGVLLQDVEDLARRTSIDNEGNLSIEPTMMSDLGEYECHVQNTAGEVQVAKAFLNIQYRAKVIRANPEVYLPYGQPAVLDCHFRANPPLKNLRWEKDGLLFDSYNVPGVFYKMNGSLFFAKVDENDAGSYTCTPYNDLGTDGPSPVINVIVLRPPIFKITPKAIYIHKLGETVQFPCEAIDRDGNNKPAIVWTRRDGHALPLNRTFQSVGNLTITNVVESDRGAYECSATNEAATVTAETELMIENLAPRPPYNLTANSTETTISLRWLPGYLRPNLEYTVWYRLSDAPEWRTLRIVDKNSMEVTIHNLLPGREYEFMVLSQDKSGDGMFSKQFRFPTQPKTTSNEVSLLPNASNTQQHTPKTHDSVDPTKEKLSEPWNLNVIRNQQGWLLNWEHAVTKLDKLRIYSVSWWKEPEHFLIGTAETFDNFYQLRYLKEDSTYKLQVMAIKEDGTKVPSREFILQIPSQRRLRALVIGCSVAVIFLLCALCAFLYVKRSCLKHLIAPKMGVDNTDAVGVVDKHGIHGRRSATEADIEDTGDEAVECDSDREFTKVQVT